MSRFIRKTFYARVHAVQRDNIERWRFIWARRTFLAIILFYKLFDRKSATRAGVYEWHRIVLQITFVTRHLIYINKLHE